MTVGSIFHCPSRLPHHHPAFSRSPFSFSRFSLSLLPAGAEGKKPQCIQPIRDTHTAALSQPRTTGRRSASLTTFPSRDYVGSVAACGEYAILMQFTSNICLLMRYRPPTSILLPVTCINQNRSTVGGWGWGMTNIVDVYYDVFFICKKDKCPLPPVPVG